MKIVDVIEEEKIIFDNGNEITFDHDQCCCEYNYADLGSIKNDVYFHEDFDPDLTFKFIDDLGFVFGNPGKWIFVPCYSEQNGYYTTDIDIYYNGKLVTSGDCKEVFV